MTVSEEHAELEALHKLDEKCALYQQQGDYTQALEYMERGLVLRRHFFGLDSKEVSTARKSAAELCNLLSMTFLQQEDYPVALELLKKAHILTETHPEGRSTTLNNMACYYRRLGKLHASLSCLLKALKLEASLAGRGNNRADTHLNVCAVMSQLGKHRGALHHAQSGLLLLQEELFSKQRDANMTPMHQQKDRVSVLCIAYHNIGVEHEYLQDYEQCIVSYRKGVGLAEQYVGPDAGVTITLRNSYLAAKRTVAVKRRKNKGLLPAPVAKKKNPKPPTAVAAVRPVTQKQLVSACPTSVDLPSVPTPVVEKIIPVLSPHDPYFSPRSS